MEIKAKINKPYTEEQRVDFIIEYNQKQGYGIQETETALEAWGLTAEEETEQKEQEFYKEFFLTSLGYIRRSVSMQDGSKKDFLSDLLPTISMAVSQGTPVNVIAYDKPDFTQEIHWEDYQHMEIVTPQFIQECFLQLQNDFLPIN